MTGESNTPIIRRRTPAERARYLEARVDELITEADSLKPKRFAIKSLGLLFAISEALADFAVILEDVEDGEAIADYSGESFPIEALDPRPMPEELMPNGI